MMYMCVVHMRVQTFGGFDCWLVDVEGGLFQLCAYSFVSAVFLVFFRAKCVRVEHEVRGVRDMLLPVGRIWGVSWSALRVSTHTCVRSSRRFLSPCCVLLLLRYMVCPLLYFYWHALMPKSCALNSPFHPPPTWRVPLVCFVTSCIYLSRGLCVVRGGVGREGGVPGGDHRPASQAVREQRQASHVDRAHGHKDGSRAFGECFVVVLFALAVVRGS